MSIRKHILIGDRKKFSDLGVYWKGQMIFYCVILCVSQLNAIPLSLFFRALWSVITKMVTVVGWITFQNQ